VGAGEMLGQLNSNVQEFARHYKTVFWPTYPYIVRHKDKIDRGIVEITSGWFAE
jgi:hypothetical protein